ncbi:NAD(P)-dependent oxidoreductase [Aquibium carbonis]|uniref:NAD(P)-dependent oxidoreductase n=1 Tax=Aquibium carbonis TaxID=2495581 RepID=A0A3R9ZUI6_9HYPH|nr:NAD(P)-dependent oxidoreductase [Aquibium carbonis]RST88043.1 NAD(P)-dependent oxidoreductase [Aquibium carbonis]
MKILVSGGTGIVGRFVVERLAEAGHKVRVLARTQPQVGLLPNGVDVVAGTLDPTLDQSAAFEGMEGFVHAAFDHVPGKYRGGEGADPNGFRLRNLDGTMALFETAKRVGVGRVVFLSSRAAYGTQAPGRVLDETVVAHPDTIYGQVKHAAERALDLLSDHRFLGISLRVTGVYGASAPGMPHKWSGLIADYLAGVPVAPRVATEVHGHDVASAVGLMLEVVPSRLSHRLFNVSDIVLDRRDLLSMVREATGCPHALPDRADAASLGMMATDRLAALGWRPGGSALLEKTVAALPEVRQACQS